MYRPDGWDRFVPFQNDDRGRELEDGIKNGPPSKRQRDYTHPEDSENTPASDHKASANDNAEKGSQHPAKEATTEDLQNSSKTSCGSFQSKPEPVVHLGVHISSGADLKLREKVPHDGKQFTQCTLDGKQLQVR